MLDSTDVPMILLRLEKMSEYDREYLQIIHVPFDVTPPVRTHRTGTLSKVDFLVRERIVEGILAGNAAGITMESNTSKGTRSLLHL